MPSPLRSRFRKAFELLAIIRDNPSNIAALSDLNRLLFREIYQSEEKIRLLREQSRSCVTILRTARPPKGISAQLKARIRQLSMRVEFYQRIIFTTRCFGDGIAFSYCDKHALKHTFFRTDAVSMKQDAGFITGKEGLASEVVFLQELMEKGVPAVLTDLTLTIRHGDICILADDDPALIEIKSGALGNRGRKQVQAIRTLHEFYEKDEVKGLRGFETIKREAYKVPEVSYVKELNDCLEAANANGFSVAQPEKGLYYVAIYDEDAELSVVFEGLKLTRPSIYFLNQFKSEMSWAPYTPYVLSITSETQLWDFIKGNLTIIVIVDADNLCSLAKRDGCEVSWHDGDDYPLRVQSHTGEGYGGPSGQLLDRIAFEFVSPRWIINLYQDAFDRMKGAIEKKAQ